MGQERPPGWGTSEDAYLKCVVCNCGAPVVIWIRPACGVGRWDLQYRDEGRWMAFDELSTNQLDAIIRMLSAQEFLNPGFIPTEDPDDK